jgi:hypothetical protein
MKKLSILFTAIILSSQAYSQLTYSWVKTIVTPSTVVTTGIESSSSGNVFIMGQANATTDFDPSSSTFFLTPNSTSTSLNFLAKYTSTGSFIWAKEIISSSSPSSGIEISDLVIDASENVYITGSYNYTTNFDPGLTNYTLSTVYFKNAFIAKYSPIGSLVWVKDIRRGNSYQNITIGTKIALDNSNNVYFGGEVSYRPFFCKYDNAGNMLWKDSLVDGSSISSPNINQLQSMHVNGSGEVFIGGLTKGSIDMDPSVGISFLSNSGGISACFIGKYTTAGTFVWGKKIGSGASGEYPIMRDITQDALGNVYTCGVSYFGASGYKNEITKWDINGNLQWDNFFGRPYTSDYEGGFDIFITNNNQIIVSGKITTPSLSGIIQNFDPLGGVYNVTDLAPTGINKYHFVAAYSPSNGGVLWAKCIGGDIDFLSAGYFYSYSHMDNWGSIYITGNTRGAGSFNDFDPNTGIVSINLPTYNNVFFAKYTGCGTVGIEENNDVNNITVSPNPSNNKFIFSNLIGDNKIEVIDITGRLILTDYLKYSSYTLSMDYLPKGMYFYKITDAKGQLNQGKLLLQ